MEGERQQTEIGVSHFIAPTHCVTEERLANQARIDGIVHSLRKRKYSTG